jgi:hypothetical protein
LAVLEIRLLTSAATNRRFIKTNLCVFLSLRFGSRVASLPVSVNANSTDAGARVFARPRAGLALAFRREPFDSRHSQTMKQHITTLAILFLALLNLEQTQAQTAASPQTKLNVTRDLPYAEPADPRQKVDIYAAEGAKNLPVVFWIHGGGWQAGDRTNIQVKPQAFADKGFVFVSTATPMTCRPSLRQPRRGCACTACRGPSLGTA